MRSLRAVEVLLLMGGVAAVVGLGCAKERPLLSVSGPQDLVRFEVRAGGGEVLWAIAADEPTPLRGIYYGAVPPGYLQTMPAEGGLPRPFVEHEPLRVLSFTPTRGFIHWGTATGPAEMSIYDSKTWVLSLEAEGFDVEEELENPPETDPLFVIDDVE
ncbi:MAG: hypothetical protein WBI27_20005 [Thermoanaerobaculia bacterium]